MDMPNNWKQRSKANPGKLTPTQIERRRIRTNTYNAIMMIRATGRYRGTARVSALRYERAASGGGWYPVNWIDELVREGITSYDKISVNGEFPERPIQLWLVENPSRPAKPDPNKMKSFFNSMTFKINTCSDE